MALNVVATMTITQMRCARQDNVLPPIYEHAAGWMPPASEK
jgi:hypothetical protein